MALPALADILEAVAKQRPDAPAVVSGAGVTTWRSFESRAEGLALHLQRSGLSRQSSVAVYLRNGPEYLETVVGALKASMIPINVNYRYGVNELVYLFDNADVEAVVFDESFAALVAQIRERVPSIKLWYCVGHSDVDDVIPYERAVTTTGSTGSPPRSGDDLIMIYTGGTTGMPKGVMWRQADIAPVLAARSAKAGVPPPETLEELLDGASDPDEVCLVACPLMHGTGLFMALANLLAGGTIVTLTGGRFDPEELCDAVEANQVTTLILVGDPFARPLLAALDAAPRGDRIASLRSIVSAGAMWSHEVKVGLLRHNPGLTLIDSFGASETSGLGRSVSTVDDIEDTAAFKVSEFARLVTEEGRFIPQDSSEPGLLVVGGPLPVGYYKDPAKSEATFQVIDGQRYARTGDWAYHRGDGTVVFLGRGSGCINSGGEKVFPEEVEEVLKLHPGVADSAVLGLGDEKLGERVVALIELSESPRMDGHQLDETTLIAHVRARLAGYKTPKRILIVDSLERSPSGKLDYVRLRKKAENPGPSQERRVSP